ncbi:MAG: helix-turn-helix domain-containing protein [Chloroflexota bacterium]|nr:helix-turn-helix domain-containing protein [Chloroflexota bacterium]
MASSTFRSSQFRVVPAVDKAARLLAELSAPEPLGVSELARRIGASKGTVRDILMTLTMHGLIERDEDARFRIPSRDLVSLAAPRLAALMNETGQTAILGVVRDGRLEISARSEPSDLHVTAPLGRRLPLDAGAHAKVLSGADPIGYDDEEYLPGVRATAAPIVDAHGHRIAALLIVGLKDSLDLRTLRRIGERCAQVAAELSRSIQGHGGETAWPRHS